MYDDELMHYGVLGMKLGVRRTSKPSGHKINGLIRTFNPLVDGDSTYAKAVKDNILYY